MNHPPHAEYLIIKKFHVRAQDIGRKNFLNGGKNFLAARGQSFRVIDLREVFFYLESENFSRRKIFWRRRNDTALAPNNSRTAEVSIRGNGHFLNADNAVGVIEVKGLAREQFFRLKFVAGGLGFAQRADVFYLLKTVPQRRVENVLRLPVAAAV